MKSLSFTAIIVTILSAVAGCAGPVVIDDGVRSRVFIPCTQDNLCFRNTYGVAWDNYCSNYPVSYRNNDYEYESRRVEWIYQPREYAPNPMTTVYR